MRLFTIESGPCSGAYNMALDEALLETVRSLSRTDDLSAPVLIVRTYQWEVPTLSLGVNQSVRDVGKLLSLYSYDRPVQRLVRRPTGGRAILHGEDISFSFITNAPEILRESLKDAYARFADILRAALLDLGVPVRLSEEAGTKDYMRSPVCFETHTPSDLVAMNGHKLAGSAQLRRAGGLLQHGAAFLQSYGLGYADFSAALFAQTAQSFECSAETLSAFTPAGQRAKDAEAVDIAFPADFEALWQQLETAYIQESGGILEKASTTNGSHLEPASF